MSFTDGIHAAKSGSERFPQDVIIIIISKRQHGLQGLVRTAHVQQNWELTRLDFMQTAPDGLLDNISIDGYN